MHIISIHIFLHFSAIFEQLDNTKGGDLTKLSNKNKTTFPKPKPYELIKDFGKLYRTDPTSKIIKAPIDYKLMPRKR